MKIKTKIMKRVLTLFGAALLATLGMNSAVAQTQVQQGNIIIDPYYGGPNFGKSLIGTAEFDEFTVTGIGPAGIRAEYMLSDNFGMGVDFIYNSTTVNTTLDSTAYNEETYQYDVVDTYDLKLYARRYRVQLRANYHFAQTDNLDAYIGVGAGTNIRTFGFKTDFPNYERASLSGALFPVSMRLALGTRYYITDNIGFNVELGLGGPVVSGGLSLKI